jgi:UDP-glucose 4-epimerase
MKPVLVTGASSELGQIIVQTLKDKYRVFALDNKANTNEGVSFIYMDLVRNLSNLEDLGHYEVIIHTSFLNAHGETSYKASEYNNTNIKGTLNLLNNVGFDKFISVYDDTNAGKLEEASMTMVKYLTREYCIENDKGYCSYYLNYDAGEKDKLEIANCILELLNGVIE